MLGYFVCCWISALSKSKVVAESSKVVSAHGPCPARVQFASVLEATLNALMDAEVMIDEDVIRSGTHASKC